MNPLIIHRIKLVIYTISSLGVAWQTTMNGVTWSSMGWEAQSCLFAGIIVLWGQTMFAYFDKGAASASEFKSDIDKSKNGTKVTP